MHHPTDKIKHTPERPKVGLLHSEVDRNKQGLKRMLFNDTHGTFLMATIPSFLH